MKPLELTDDLVRVARRCVWFKAPDDAIRMPAHFIAHVLTFGTHADVRVLRQQVCDADLMEAIDTAPAGVFDPRSWAYWNLMLGRDEPPPMPRRRLE